MPHAKPCNGGCGRLIAPGRARCDACELPRRRVTTEDRAYVLQRANGLCELCQMAPATTVDHITPRLLGGSDDVANLQAACLSCNSRKGAR